MDNVRKVLVIELSNIGDAILTFPALHLLEKAYPQGELHILCSVRVADLFSGHPRVHRIWRWEKSFSFLKKGTVVLQLFLERFQVVVDFRHSLIPLLLIGTKRTPILRDIHTASGHRVEQHLQLVEHLGHLPRVNGSCVAWFGQEEAAFARSYGVDIHPLIVVAPGARSHTKRWQAEGFARVADQLAQNEKAQIVLVGEEAEKPIAREVQQRMREPAVDLVGRTSLAQLAALLKRARLVITNDSACLHAADAVGTPAVAIFGPTDERKYGPRHPRSKVVRRSLVCAPCELALCPYGHECMRWITADEVYEAAKHILS